ncbi:TetR/AcrR family transcriptional regulator [Novosphingobium pokkalii]|uniref:TetR/AcrR family transcriptional regulator n=1 Tax=Novosphingobium pokkalii TaxID=1770194 RepID=UPI00362CD16D
MVTNPSNCRLKRCSPDERRENILAVATEVFTQTGYGATSMSAIAAELGGSKATLYKYFPSKEQLFEAVLMRGCGAVLAALEQLAEADSDDPEAILADFGTRFLTGLCGQRSLDVYRMVHAAGLQFPEAADMFFRCGPDRAGAMLAIVLDRLARQRGVPLRDPRLAADQFLGMVRGKLHMRVAIGVMAPPDAETIAGTPPMPPASLRMGCSRAEPHLFAAQTR